MDLIKEAMCQICHKTFKSGIDQINLINTLKSKGQSFIMIECPCCGSSTQYMEAGENTLQKENQDTPYRCPIKHCSGWVGFIDIEEPLFWGCGECGSVWYKENNFQNEITSIIAIYKYRIGCYKKLNNKWYPAPISDEVSNYEELVTMEPIDSNDEFVRG